MINLVTALLFVSWTGVVAYFVVFPLIPEFQDVRSSLASVNVYTISYNATTQFFVTLSPPHYSVAEELPTEGTNNGNRRSGSSMEYVDPDGIKIAHLGDKGTVVRIDAANISGPVVDGVSQESMLEGFWHYPSSSVPGKRGNTVIFGHRFHKIPPYSDTFFNLDKVGVGDRVMVEQKGKEFSYTVVKTMVVDKNDQYVLEETGDYRLTLITCTPLWTSDKRLVVVAVQDRLSSVI